MHPFTFSSRYNRSAADPRCIIAPFLVVLAFIASGSVATACSVCGCSLSSDWAAQGYEALPGFDASLRYEYFDQTTLRRGTGRVDRATVRFPADDEIQQETRNRSTWFDVAYVASSHWGVAVALPWHDRYHTTIAAGDTAISTSARSGWGDAQIMGRYQTYGLARSYGVQFGLKVPTGRFDQNFSAGPQAGSPLDRGLQLGTGTTDLLLGASWFARAAVHLGCFAQAILDRPLGARADFLPSTSVTISGGLRWLNSSAVTPQLQLNVKTETPETGANSDRDNSGSTLAYLSPGLTADIGQNTHAFVFVQLPVYQRVNGFQLEPRMLLSVGVRMRL